MNNFSIKVIICCLTIFLESCASHSELKQMPDSPSFLTVESNIMYEEGGKATFKITNTSKAKDLFLFHPEEIEIEKQTANGWETVEVLYCPCGASCPPPPEWRTLKPAESKVISWNLQRQWCEGTSLHGNIPKTKNVYAGEGKYRIAVRYTLNKNHEIKSYYKGFKLKSKGE